MKRALDKLRWAKLFGRLLKCEFLKDTVNDLGFKVSKEAIRTSPANVKAILDGPDRSPRMPSDHFWDSHHITESLFAAFHNSQSP